MQQDQPTRFAYAARSAAEDDDRSSTDSQLAAIRARIGSPAAEFAESGYSGSKGNRGPELQAAIDAATAAAAIYGQAELWAFHSSRFGRGSGKLGEARALGKLFYDLRAVGVALRTVEDDEFVTNEQLIGIASSQAAKYAADLSAHTRRGMKARKDRGAPVGAVPFGYRIEKTVVGGEVVASRVVDHVTAGYVAEMFAAIADGAVPGDVVRSLNARGVRTQRGGTWNARAVRQLIRRRLYVGEDGYPRLLDDDLWERANASLGRLDPAAVQRRKGGRPPSEAYLLRGLAFCRCGAPIYCVTGRYGSHGDRHYVCRDKFEARGLCDAPPVLAVLAEYRVLEHLRSFVGSVEGWLAERRVDREQEQAERQLCVVRARDELAKADRRVAKAETRLDAALDDDELVEGYARAVARAIAARDEAAGKLSNAEAVAAEFSAEPEEDAALALVDRLDALSGLAVGALVLATIPREEIRQALADALSAITLGLDEGQLRAEFALRVELGSEGTSTTGFRAVPLPALVAEAAV